MHRQSRCSRCARRAARSATVLTPSSPSTLWTDGRAHVPHGPGVPCIHGEHVESLDVRSTSCSCSCSALPPLPNLQHLRLNTTCTHQTSVPASHALRVLDMTTQSYLVLPSTTLPAPTCTLDIRYDPARPFGLFPSHKAFPPALQHVVLGFSSVNTAHMSGSWASFPMQLAHAVAHGIHQGLRFTIVGMERMRLWDEPQLRVVRCLVDELSDTFGWGQRRIDDLPSVLEFVTHKDCAAL